MKVCEWAHLGFGHWEFRGFHSRKSAVYARIYAPKGYQNESGDRFRAEVKAFNSEKQFATWEEAKAWAEAEVGKLFKVYR